MSQYSVLEGALVGNLTIVIEYSGNNPLYIGKARPGSADSDAVWQIQRLTYSGSNMTNRDWASADAGFVHIWDNRAALSYS